MCPRQPARRRGVCGPPFTPCSDQFDTEIRGLDTEEAEVAEFFNAEATERTEAFEWAALRAAHESSTPTITSARPLSMLTLVIAGALGLAAGRRPAPLECFRYARPARLPSVTSAASVLMICVLRFRREL